MAIAFFSTWTTYGTWLPGDTRGWFKSGRGLQEPDAIRLFAATLLMTESAIRLDTVQRALVERTIAEHCRIRNWELHAVACRTNHVHVLVSAGEYSIEVPREQFKAWCTRKLRHHDQNDPADARRSWWTERGWDEYIDDEHSLAQVVQYIVDEQ